MKNYLIYPTKKMYISQSYTGNYSHNLNSKGTPKDYPIDESCGSNAKDYFYCPCDEMIVKRIYGVGGKGTNTIWLESTSKVLLANGKESYVTIMVIHPEDDTLKNIKKGDKYKRGEKMFVEGSDGNSTGNHFHISVSAAKYVSGGWEENNKGAWVIKGKPIKPEDAFWLDENFTKVSNSRGLTFKKLPKYIGSPVERDETKTQIEVIATELRARKKPNGEVLGFINVGVYNIFDMALDKDYTWFEVEEGVWIASKENEWTKLYSSVEKPKQEEIIVDGNVSSETNNTYYETKEENDPILWFIEKIVEFLKKLFKK